MTDQPSKVRQRKFFTSTEFEFLPQRLTYTFRNLSGSRQTAIDYADISFDSRRISERYAAYLYIGLVLFGVGSLLGGLIYETEGRVSGFNYAIIGLIFLVGFFVQRREYVVLAAGNETLLILGDKQSQGVLTEIDRLRRARFMEILSRPDLVNDEVKRQGLIAWLQERQVLSGEEAESLLKGHEISTPASRKVVY